MNGYFIWKVENFNNEDNLINTVINSGADIVYIKVADGTLKFNSQYNLDYIINSLRTLGIKVGGWAFIYDKWPIEQSNLLNELNNKYNFHSFLLDVEDVSSIGCNWSTNSNSKNIAKQLLDNLNKPNFGFCSYKFPTLHPGIPYKIFLDHSKISLNVPQIYWQGAQNSVEQLIRSYDEYKDYTSKPFFPAGAMYEEHGWKPTTQSIKSFYDYSNEHFLGSIYWSLDAAKNHKEWLNILCEDCEEEITSTTDLYTWALDVQDFLITLGYEGIKLSKLMSKYKVVSSYPLSVRSTPAGNRIGSIAPGTIVTLNSDLAVKKKLNGIEYTWVNIKTPFSGYVAMEYLEKV